MPVKNKIKKTIVKKTSAKKVKNKVVKKTSPKRVLKKTKTMASHKAIHAHVRRKNDGQGFSFKRMLYMILSVILGLICMSIVQDFLEKIYINDALENGHKLSMQPVLWYNTYLPPAVPFLFIFAGLFLGMILGTWGWQIVYVEKRHPAFKK